MCICFQLPAAVVAFECYWCHWGWWVFHLKLFILMSPTLLSFLQCHLWYSAISSWHSATAAAAAGGKVNENAKNPILLLVQLLQLVVCSIFVLYSYYKISNILNFNSSYFLYFFSRILLMVSYVKFCWHLHNF